MTAPKPYAAFGRALRDAMSAAGYDRARLSAEAGYNKTHMSSTRTGSRIPRPATVARIAHILDAPHLVRIANKALEAECPQCHKRFVRKLRGNERFCSGQCRRRWHYQAEKDRRPTPADRLRSQARTIPWLESEVERVEKERDAIREVIAAGCWACEPEGLCRDATSPYREYSPLPLADERLRVA